MPIAPIVALVASVVPEILNLFGRGNEAKIADKIGGIARSIAGESDIDKAADAIAADPAMALQFKQAVLSQQTELARMAFEQEKLYVTDTQDARKYRDDKVFALGVVILATFGIAVGVVMWGGYEIMRGGVSIEAGMFAAITGFIGTLIGYVAANAQQVVSYFFGSSRGSSQKTDAIADSIKAIGEQRK